VALLLRTAGSCESFTDAEQAVAGFTSSRSVEWLTPHRSKVEVSETPWLDEQL